MNSGLFTYLLEGLLRDVLEDGHWLRLSHSESSSDGLLFGRWIPLRLDYMDSIGVGQC